MWDAGHPYRWRTWLRTNLPWFLIDLGIADKGEDCEKVGGAHSWYNKDNISSACYHCKVTRQGRLWENAMHVNGLPLPRSLIHLMNAERWKPPIDVSGISRLIPENDGLYLYSITLMEAETQALFRDCSIKTNEEWLGVPDREHPPGDIDPSLTVLIADIGIGYDQPIALDYMDTPRVLTLQWSQGGKDNRWIVIASNIENFAEAVGL